MNAQIDFEKMHGLVPTIVQDDATDEVLMLGFMNPEAFDKTLNGGYVTFFSRTRNELWTKGESSGNRLKVFRLLPTVTAIRFLYVCKSKGRALFAIWELGRASRRRFHSSRSLAR